MRFIIDKLIGMTEMYCFNQYHDLSSPKCRDKRPHNCRTPCTLFCNLFFQSVADTNYENLKSPWKFNGPAQKT